MDGKHKTIELADFAANCTDILTELNNGSTYTLDVVKDGKLVALVKPPHQSIYGYLRGRVVIPEGCDMTGPVFEGEIHADSGRIHE